MQAMHTACLPLPAHWVNLMQNGNPGQIISKKRHRYQDHQKGLFPDGQSIPCPQNPPDPDKKNAPIVLSKASRSNSGNLSHLLSLSTTQILAHAHQLLDLPPTDIGAPEPIVPPELTVSPEPNTSADPSISPDPKRQPFDALAASQ